MLRFRFLFINYSPDLERWKDGHCEGLWVKSKEVFFIKLRNDISCYEQYGIKPLSIGWQLFSIYYFSGCQASNRRIKVITCHSLSSRPPMIRILVWSSTFLEIAIKLSIVSPITLTYHPYHKVRTIHARSYVHIQTYAH